LNERYPTLERCMGGMKIVCSKYMGTTKKANCFLGGFKCHSLDAWTHSLPHLHTVTTTATTSLLSSHRQPPFTLACVHVHFHGRSWSLSTAIIIIIKWVGERSPPRKWSRRRNLASRLHSNVQTATTTTPWNASCELSVSCGRRV